MRDNLKIIISYSEVGAGTRGAGLGPEALQIAAFKKGIDLFSRYPVIEGGDTFRHFYRHPDKTAADFLEVFPGLYNEIAGNVRETLLSGSPCLIVTGDHSNAAGSIAGVKDAYPDKRIGVIWIDAHGDLHTPYTSPSMNVHGMPLGVALGLDNKELAVRNLSDKHVKIWDDMKRAGKHRICPKITPEDLVFIDIRDLEEQEWQYIKDHNIKHFTPEDRRDLGILTVINQTIEHLQHCDYIYVTFDVDSMDSAIADGTGTPVPDGLSVAEARRLLAAFAALPNLAALEITEINPLLGFRNNLAETVAADLLPVILPHNH